MPDLDQLPFLWSRAVLGDFPYVLEPSDTLKIFFFWNLLFLFFSGRVLQQSLIWMESEVWSCP